MELREILMKLERINDPRQQSKITHLMMDVIGIVLMGVLGNADDWKEIQMFAVMNEEFLRKYLELPKGIPSHDTLERVMALVDPREMNGFIQEWNEYVNSNEGAALKKVLNIDGKTLRGSGRKGIKPLHVISAWSHEDGISLGQRCVDEKENEIVAIPELLDEIRITGYVVTIDAMGTQKKIAEKIKEKRADYVLAVKANQPRMHEEIASYFADDELRSKIEEVGNRHVTKEKSRGQIETRRYYQTSDIGWFEDRAEWKGLKSIGMVETMIERDGRTTVERRYYISSLAEDIGLFARAVRGHWNVESMHWQLDVTFREDANTTQDKRAAENMNIIRKWALAILKLLDVGMKASLKAKRKAVGWNPGKFLAMALEI